METYFDGTLEEWLNQIPEMLIDDVIRILDIDPTEYQVPSGYSPFDVKEYPHDIKTCLWKDLVHIIARWGIPAPVHLETSPSQMKEYAEDIHKKISKSLEVLKALSYEKIYSKGSMTKEFKFAFGLRQISELLNRNRGGDRRSFISPLVIKQEYEDSGSWEEHYPLDQDIKSAEKALSNILEAITVLQKDRDYTASKGGEKKKGKDRHDTLIWALCYVYKKYTGKSPMSWNTGTSAFNSGQFTGGILPFLQIVLPYTAYSGSLESGALQKKIMRIKKSGKHKDVWSDSN
jgi:hypothetical protein